MRADHTPRRRSSALAPVDRRRETSRRVYEAILAAVVDLELEPGQVVSEGDLATRLGVSRTPVREALIRLRGRGLVEIIPQVGTYVTRIDTAQVAEAQFIREALETACAHRAVRWVTAGDTAELRDILDRQRRLARGDDFYAFHAVDELLHRRTSELSGHATVWQAIRSAKVHLDRVRRLSLPMPGLLDRLIDQHTAIVDALARRDGDAADRAVRTHMREVLRVVPELAARHPRYFTGVGDSADLPRPMPVRRAAPRPVTAKPEHGGRRGGTPGG